jgi:enterochelin esterase-like enzyme
MKQWGVMPCRRVASDRRGSSVRGESLATHDSRLTAHRKRLACFGLLIALFVAPALASDIVTREFESPALARKWSYAVYLPSGYETSGSRYPVLYLLHGNGQNLYSWIEKGRIQSTVDALIEKSEMPPAIIVMPDAGTTWFVDRKEKMESAFLRDLIPDVEREFRAITTRNGRLIAGLSMGGYGAIRFTLKHPDMFAAAGLLSPAIYDPVPPENSGARRVGVFGAPDFDPAIWKSLNYPALWEAYLAKKLPVPMYICSGDDDEYFIEAEAAGFYALLRENGQPAELRIVDGAHNWSLWSSAIADALRYVFRYAAQPAAPDKSP